MQFSETVTFGGSSLDRAAELRGNPHALAEIAASPESRALLFWRGKPLVEGEAEALSLVRLPMDHPILEGLAQPFFLGCEGEAAGVFACDLRGWAPDDLDEAAMREFLDRSEQAHPALAEGQRFAELRAIMARIDARDAELAATARALSNWHGTHQFCARCGQPSDVVMAGWQRTCPSCNAPHFPRTDPVVIMLITHGNSVLMGRSPHFAEGMYSLLAGFVEPGETIEAAVRREVFEESGIRVGHVRYLSSQPWAFPNSLMIGCAGEALNGDITVDPAELEDALWVTREEMMDIFAGRSSVMKAARKGAIAHFLLRNWLADRVE